MRIFKTLLAALFALSLQAGLMAATKKKPAPQKEEAKPAEEVKKEEPTPAPTAEPTKEAAKEEVKKAEAPAKAEIPHKSPGLAAGLAVFPGLIVHGTGHMYAGSWMKGLGLLAIEGAAAGLATQQITSGIDEIQKLTSGTKNGIPTDMSPALSRVGVVLVCTSVFLWSWFDDMAGAGIAAGEYNRKAQEAAAQQSRFRVTPRENGAEVALTTQF